MNAPATELDETRAVMKATWSAGDYGKVATGLRPGALDFLGRLEVTRGDRVLDVACGTGQIAIPLAREGARVSGLDIAPNLLDQARARARDEALDIDFVEGNAEKLPWDDGTFDVVVSLIGAMFAPRPERVAAEMMRVCKPGGRIVMGNWTPDGFSGSFFRTIAKYAPPPADVPSPLLWGTMDAVTERFGNGVTDLSCTHRAYTFEYPFGPAEVVDHYLAWFGPVVAASVALDTAGRAALRGDLEALWTSRNQATDGSTRLEGEILEVVATRG